MDVDDERRMKPEDIVGMNVRGALRWALRTDLMKSGDSYFTGMLKFTPDSKGYYMINR